MYAGPAAASYLGGLPGGYIGVGTGAAAGSAYTALTNYLSGVPEFPSITTIIVLGLGSLFLYSMFLRKK